MVLWDSNPVVWKGNAQPRAQVTHLTPADVEAGDVFIVALNGKNVSYTAQDASVADVTAGLVAALDATTEPEFDELTVQDAATHVILTGRSDGRPFTVTTSTVNGGAADTQTLSASTVVEPTGPNHWDNPDNWSTGSVPTSGDVVFIPNSSVSILYGLEQSSVLLTGLSIGADFTGQIGLPRINRQASADYAEYLPRYLAIGAVQLEIGDGTGAGSDLIRLDTGENNTAVTVFSTGLPAEENYPTVIWKGTGPTPTFNVLGGSVGVAVEAGQQGIANILRASGGQIQCGPGTTLATVEVSGSANLHTAASLTTLVQTGGETTIVGSAGATTISLKGGRLDYRSSGTIANLNIDGEDALADFSADPRPRTVTNASLGRGAIDDPHETVVWTNGIQPGRMLTGQ